MKLSELKNLIREEIYNRKLSIIHESVTILHEKWQTQRQLHEGILTSIFKLILEPKYRKKIEAYKNSPEYKELLQQVKVTSDALEVIAKKLKIEIDNYETGISKLQKMGLKVNSTMSSNDQYKAFKEWEARQTEKTKRSLNNLKFINSLKRSSGTKSDFNFYNN